MYSLSLAFIPSLQQWVWLGKTSLLGDGGAESSFIFGITRGQRFTARFPSQSKQQQQLTLYRKEEGAILCSAFQREAFKYFLFVLINRRPVYLTLFFGLRKSVLWPFENFTHRGQILASFLTEISFSFCKGRRELGSRSRCDTYIDDLPEKCKHENGSRDPWLAKQASPEPGEPRNLIKYFLRTAESLFKYHRVERDQGR